MNEFDVWTDDSGNITATEVTARFVDDSDAPYGYCHHAMRLSALSKRSAMAKYRALM